MKLNQEYGQMILSRSECMERLEVFRSSLSEIKKRFEQEARLVREKETAAASLVEAEDEIAISRK